MPKLAYLLTFSIIVLSCTTGGAQDNERPIIVLADGLPRPLVQHIQINGLTRQGESIGFSLTRSNDGIESITIAARRNNREIGSMVLSNHEFPFVDVFTTDIGYSADMSEITFSYGDRRRHCFVNYDGRNRVGISFFSNGTQSITITTYDKCNPRTEERRVR